MIPDDLRNKIKQILPLEKPNKTIGRPLYHLGVLDGILCMCWELSVNGRGFQRNMVLVLLHIIEDFEWTTSKVFQKLWVKLLEVYY